MIIDFPYFPLMFSTSVGGTAHCYDPVTNDEISLETWREKYGYKGYINDIPYNSLEERNQIIKEIREKEIVKNPDGSVDY